MAPSFKRAALGARQAGHAGLHGFEIDDVEQRAIGEQRRQQRVLAHLRVGDADIFGHQERGGAHHRRHQLAVDAGRAFDRAGLHRRVADALHQRDGEGAGGHHIGDRRAGDHAGHAGRHDRGLGGPAAELPEQRERDLDEIIAGAGLLQQRAEQHEQEDEIGRDAERDAEHALGGEPEMRGGARDRCALVRHQAGQPGPGEHVEQRTRCAMIGIHGPSARRDASSSSTTPTIAAIDVQPRRQAGTQRDVW